MREWLFLIYLLPARHAHARVNAWRRLQRIGAVSLKNSAYVLPNSPEAREDFEWIKSDILAIGGQAMLLVADAPDAATEDEIVAAFRATAASEYEALARKASRLLAHPSKPGSKGANRRRRKQALRRLREWFDQAMRVDFFDAPGRKRAADLLARLEGRADRSRRQ